MSTPVFRFAPSPNGRLHLGHAASAVLNADCAARLNGRFLLRIEDIDTTRCRSEFDAAVLEDLAWLGLRWEEPVVRQSTRFQCYGEALQRLAGQGLLYPCFCTRREMAAESAGGPTDPDGAPLYSGRCRTMAPSIIAQRIAAGEPYALRLRMDVALAQAGVAPTWREAAPGTAPVDTAFDPLAWGDVVLKRKEFPASYHLAVVVDDAWQGVTHVVRGQDLFASTAVHALLQRLLGLPSPVYHHHGLILGEDARKLSKSLGSPTLGALRAAGLSPQEVRAMAVIPPPARSRTPS